MKVTKLSETAAGLPETDDEWDKFFRANHWRGSELQGDEVPTAGNYDRSHHYEDSSSKDYPTPNRQLHGNDKTLCHDCAYFMAYGDGDEGHEPHFDRGMRELEAHGIYGSNITLNDTDQDGVRVPPPDDQCFICGQQVDPELENFHGNRGQGTVGVRAHVFQPGDPGYHNPYPSSIDRRAGAVSRASDTVWR